MKRLCQRDPLWNTVSIGESGLSLGRYGCTITAICMIHSKFFNKGSIMPFEAAKQWSFTKQGLIEWTKSVFPNMKFVHRGYTYDEKDISTYALQRSLGVIVEVDNSHWCAVWQWIPLAGPILFDPWDGTVLWNWKKKYKKITGYALFKKNTL